MDSSCGACLGTDRWTGKLARGRCLATCFPPHMWAPNSAFLAEFGRFLEPLYKCWYLFEIEPSSDGNHGMYLLALTPLNHLNCASIYLLRYHQDLQKLSEIHSIDQSISSRSSMPSGLRSVAPTGAEPRLTSPVTLCSPVSNTSSPRGTGAPRASGRLGTGRGAALSR